MSNARDGSASINQLTVGGAQQTVYSAERLLPLFSRTGSGQQEDAGG